MRSFSNTPFSSISFTKGRTLSSANWRMLSRKRISSSVSVVRGEGAAACNMVSGIQEAPSREVVTKDSSTEIDRSLLDETVGSVGQRGRWKVKPYLQFH